VDTKKFLKRGEGIQPGEGIYRDSSKELKVKYEKAMHQKLMQSYQDFQAPKTIRIQVAPGKYEVTTI
jgi:hypothetical protein